MVSPINKIGNFCSPGIILDKLFCFEDEIKTDGASSMFYDLSERLASIAYENPDDHEKDW